MAPKPEPQFIFRVENVTCSILYDVWEARCEQKYIYRPLQALENGTSVQAYFKFPSSCVCYIHSPRLLKKKGSQLLKSETKKIDKTLTEVEPTCEGSAGFCTQVSHYPKADIKRLLEQKAFKNFFITNIDVPPTLKTGNTHSGGHDIHSSLCESELITMKPESVNPVNSNVSEIVAQYEDGTYKIIQAFQIEQCK